MYKFRLNDMSININHFTENLDSTGVLSMSVQGTQGVISLGIIRDAMKSGSLHMEVLNGADETVWASDNYMVSNASITYNEGGTYFYLNGVPRFEGTEVSQEEINFDEQGEEVIPNEEA